MAYWLIVPAVAKVLKTFFIHGKIMDVVDFMSLARLCDFLVKGASKMSVIIIIIIIILKAVNKS